LSDQGLFATSAAVDVTETDGGKTFFKPLNVSPQLEHQVKV
jgi:hypothetical protein